MKRLVALLPVLLLVACAEREKPADPTPAPEPVATATNGVQTVKVSKFNGMDVKKPFMQPQPAVGGAAAAAASASAAPSASAK